MHSVSKVRAIRTLAHHALSVCIVGITRLTLGVFQPDPPGLKYDDLRLLPPWRGSSLFWGKFAEAQPRIFLAFSQVYLSARIFVPKRKSIPSRAGTAGTR